MLIRPTVPVQEPRLRAYRVVQLQSRQLIRTRKRARLPEGQFAGEGHRATAEYFSHPQTPDHLGQRPKARGWWQVVPQEGVQTPLRPAIDQRDKGKRRGWWKMCFPRMLTSSPKVGLRQLHPLETHYHTMLHFLKWPTKRLPDMAPHNRPLFADSPTRRYGLWMLDRSVG